MHARNRCSCVSKRVAMPVVSLAGRWPSAQIYLRILLHVVVASRALTEHLFGNCMRQAQSNRAPPRMC